MSEVTQPQPVTPELRQWIIEQAKAGVQPESVLQSMVASGWREDVAIAALEDTLRGFLDERAKVAQLPPAVPVPDPLPAIAGIPTTLQAGDREVRVVLAMRDPRVIVFGGLLSHEECDELMAMAGKRLARSETVQTDTGASEVNEARTSQGMFFDRGENELCRRIEARIAALLDWPVENGEGLQVLHYRPGAEYKPHYDYFDPAQSGTPTILKRGGQRVATAGHVPQRPGDRRRHHLPRRAARGGAGEGQRGLLQLRARPPGQPHAARRRTGGRGREVGRHQVAA